MKDVISCSRRTDIPAMHYKWLQECLAEQKVTLVNAYNNKPYDVDLSPENVHSIVLWSKDYQHLLKDPGLLSKYNLYFQFTINGYDEFMEPMCPGHRTAIAQVKELCKRYSPKQVSWRFDPIMFCDQAEMSGSWEHRIDMFEEIAEELAEYSIDRCTFSFISIYGKVLERFANNGVDCTEILDEQKITFTKEMLEIAQPLGIQLYCCCQEILRTIPYVQKSHCVDGNLLQELFGGKVSKASDSGQRLECGCTKSKDIGSYTQKCGHRCLYCYANPTAEA